MNRKTTPILLAVVIAMGVLAFLSERTRIQSASRPSAGAAPTILTITEDDLQRVRVKRDYWNTYTLTRVPDGSWRLTDPSDEPAAEPAVRRMVAALTALPTLSTMDLPANDSERHREYGLWKPVLELTVTTLNGDETLIFGTGTADGAGVYCARAGRDKVFVTSRDALQALSQDLSAFRQEKSQP